MARKKVLPEKFHHEKECEGEKRRRVALTHTDVLLPPQKLLGISQAEIRQKCQERVKELEELKTTVDSLKVMTTMTRLLQTPSRF